MAIVAGDHVFKHGRVAARVRRVDAMLWALVIMWGVAFAALKQLGQTLDPYQMTWFRYVPFLAFYGVWLVLRRRERFAQVEGKDWPRFAIAGTFGVIGYHFPLNWGIDGPGGITAGTAAILVATTPLWTLFFTAMVGQESFDLRKLAGSIVAFAGVGVIIVLGPVGGADLTFARKALVVMLAPILWAMYSIVARPLIAKYGGLFVTGVTFCVGTLQLVPLGIRYGVEPLQALSTSQWWWLAFLSIGATVLGYTVWNAALKVRTATEVTVYIYLVPVFATLAGWFILGEPVTFWFLLGAALVLGGLWWLHRMRPQP